MPRISNPEFYLPLTVTKISIPFLLPYRVKTPSFFIKFIYYLLSTSKIIKYFVVGVCHPYKISNPKPGQYFVEIKALKQIKVLIW